MSGQREREWRFNIEDMIRFAERVIVYTEGARALLPLSIDHRVPPG